MSRERAVGLVLVLEPEGGGKTGVLSVRDSEDSIPGGCQLTFHGGVKLDKGESLKDALRRETKEEIVELFARAGYCTPTQLLDFVDAQDAPGSLKYEGWVSTKRKQVASVSLVIRDAAMLALLNPLVDLLQKEGVVRLVTAENIEGIAIIDPKNVQHREQGFPPEVNAMFKDERDVLAAVLNR